MSLFKNKLDYSLKHSISSKSYKKYRVNIYCKSLPESIEKKVKSYKGTVIRSIPSLNFICASLTPLAIERLIELPEIEHISEDSYAFLCGNSVLTANGISLKGKYNLTGKGIGIAVIDSGCYPHSDLQKPNNKLKKFTDLLNKFKYPYDDNGHGTFVSGILCGSGYSSKGMYRGVAENSSLYVIKAFNSLGRAFISDILFGLELIIEDAAEYAVRVVCLPFELLEHNPFILNLFSICFDRLNSLGIIPVVPSGSLGNEEGTIRGIATLYNCITVGGLDTTNSTTPYCHSSSGPFGKLEKPNLAAACVDICSLNTNVKYISEKNGIKLFPQSLERPYITYTGTSCAVAFICGVIAMLLENNKALTFKDIGSLLKVSSTMINASRWTQGAGVIDISKLLP